MVRTLRPDAVARRRPRPGRQPLRGPAAARRAASSRPRLPQQPGDYRLEVAYPTARRHDTYTVDDPYRFLPTLGEIDLHLISEGRHEQLWEVLGAHVRTLRRPRAAPVAGHVVRGLGAATPRGVRVTGDFNSWDGRAHPMRSLGASGVWELFVPASASARRYKFAGPRRRRRVAARRPTRWPSTPRCRRPPRRSSSSRRYTWGDDAWMAERGRPAAAHERPMSVYEVHLGSWRHGLSYRELADELVAYVVDDRASPTSSSCR